MENLKFLINIYKRYWLLFVFAFIGSLLESGALAGMAYLVKNVIDDVFISKSYESLIFVIFVLIILAIIKQTGFLLKDFLYPLIIFKALKNLRETFYNKLLSTEPSYLMKLSTGNIISRFTNDLERFSQISSMIGINVITEVLTIIAIIGVLIYRDWKLFLIFVISVPFLALALNYFGEKRKKYSRKLQESLADYTQHISQVISGFEIVKIFNRNIFKKIFEKINNELYKREKKNQLYESLYVASVEIIAYAATAGIIFYGGVRIIKGEITAGDFFSFLGGILILVNSLQVLQRGVVNLKALSPVIDRIKFLLDFPEEKDEGIEFKGLKEKIEYKNVSLRIDKNQILKDINLIIKKGEKVGIVGATGSGKSTLIKILPALIKDYQGKVFLDNNELRKYSVSSLRKHIGMISQEVFIFNDTLRNNLLIAKPDATDEELYEALKKAKADFVFKLEKGLDTNLGEKGSRLSGGERQRISIARIFLKNPDIVIIDEGTSALDVETEEYIMEEIKKEFSDKTIIMITHRLKVLDIVNKIIVMDNGKIIEEGSKEELLKKKGIFYKLYTLSNT
ncbi:ABC transporter ATP-binding protein [Hydrogenothermus marinus]|uniref:ATP-binding cassette, subfamily B, MsbA n=1 Tax=Hydrogenothermus marinus TaxID=133270 RepID=A0A3M0BIM6_9AQUI|nr:ABC transporter ATP-binding protein [Hydrogenothermus marinus]RMA97007.1 ATP-binding cassette, subfamily B, MsbA [Hydrogenothermus marinus]